MSFNYGDEDGHAITAEQLQVIDHDNEVQIDLQEFLEIKHHEVKMENKQRKLEQLTKAHKLAPKKKHLSKGEMYRKRIKDYIRKKNDEVGRIQIGEPKTQKQMSLSQLKDMKNRGPGFRSEYGKELLSKSMLINKEVKRMNNEVAGAKDSALKAFTTKA